MAKILLVEDDNNLREIYEARLQAEGYTIISAKDGEEALVKAKQERPDLIISDVMMPRISGFEMLDILRNTEGLKDAKVIMLTALGQAEDKTRADALGADRYLVKSQVTLEDIVKAADELLNGSTTPVAAANIVASPAPTPVAMPMAQPPSGTPTPVSAAPASMPVPVATPTPIPVAPRTPPVVPSAPIATPPPVTTPPAQIPVASPPAAAIPAPVISMPASSVAPPPVVPTPAVTPPAAPISTPVATAAIQPAPPQASAATSVAPVPSAQPAVTPTAPPIVPAATAPVPAANPSPVVSSAAPIAEEDDKLIADAVKNLSATLDKDADNNAAPPTANTQDADAKSALPIQVEAPQKVESPTAESNTNENQPSVTAPSTDTSLSTPTPQTPTALPPRPTPQAQGTEGAQSTADEQAQMQAQIEDFISKQGTSSAATDSPSTTPDSNQATPSEPEIPTVPLTSAATASTAVSPSSAAPDVASTPTTTSAVPTPVPEESQPAPARQRVTPPDNEDNVTIAHKKIIQPPVEPLQTQPNLSELLAREGISDLEETHPDGQVITPGSTTPHQPGHVISPDGTGQGTTSAFNADDPNSIAL